MTAFSRCLSVTLSLEGGYVDDPADPGGATNRGITQRTYDAWRTHERLPTRDVQQISDGDVTAIYYGEYWRAAQCEGMDVPIALCLFDAAVNVGVLTARRFLTDAGADIDAYCDRRLAYYDGLVQEKPALRRFLTGWHNRVRTIRQTAAAWAAEPTPPLAA